MPQPRGPDGGTDVARIRQGSLRLLSAGYGRPSAEVTTGVVNGFEALLELGVSDFAFAAALERWVAALAIADPGRISSEHVRLFGSGMDGDACPPIESQQVGSNLQGDAARHAGRIEDLMRRSGFSSTHDAVPPDHLQVQLELASALCAGEASARESGTDPTTWLEWQLELVSVLSSWVGDYASKVASRDRVGVHANLAAATADYLEHDHDLVRMLLTIGGTAV